MRCFGGGDQSIVGDSILSPKYLIYKISIVVSNVSHQHQSVGQVFTGNAMQKTEIPVIPMDSASGRFESNHPDITASFELMDTISCHVNVKHDHYTMIKK